MKVLLVYGGSEKLQMRLLRFVDTDNETGLNCIKINIVIQKCMSSHHCKNIIIHCIDFRFIKVINAFMNDQQLTGNCDVISVAGGVKNLVEPAEPQDRTALLKQIELSKKLHGVSAVYLVNHEDCGAYGGKQSFESDVRETEHHERHLRDASDMLATIYPDFTIHSYIARLNGALEKI